MKKQIKTIGIILAKDVTDDEACALCAMLTKMKGVNVVEVAYHDDPYGPTSVARNPAFGKKKWYAPWRNK